VIKKQVGQLSALDCSNAGTEITVVCCLLKHLTYLRSLQNLKQKKPKVQSAACLIKFATKTEHWQVLFFFWFKKYP
jgi:hypothetical protein